MRPEKITMVFTPTEMTTEPPLTLEQILHVAADMASCAILDASLTQPDHHDAAAECIEWLHTNVATVVYQGITQHEASEETQ